MNSPEQESTAAALPSALLLDDATSDPIPQEPEAIQDFDLDLLGSPKPDLAPPLTDSELMLLDLLELEEEEEGASTGLRNDVMLTTGGLLERSLPAGQLGQGGYVPEEEVSRVRSDSYSR